MYAVDRFQDTREAVLSELLRVTEEREISKESAAYPGSTGKAGLLGRF